MQYLKSNILRQVFNSSFRNLSTFKCLGDSQANPGHVAFEGVEMYVYIKNLSPAYFNNKDVWRAQLTGVDILKTIKDSTAVFIMLGYDAENDVYATWNPYQLKQRIGTANSPSFYSRLSLQKEVSKSGEIKFQNLNNDLELLVFPRSKIAKVLSNLNSYFSDSSNYVAVGSKRRGNANAAYKQLFKNNFVYDYARFLIQSGYKSSDIQRYCSLIKTLKNSNLVPQYKKIFLACDSVNEYLDVIPVFFDIDDVKNFAGKNIDVYLRAFTLYIKSIIGESNSTLDTPENSTSTENNENDSENTIEYESDYEDEQGNLTKITNPSLLKQIRPYLDTEYPSIPPVYNIIYDFYGNKYPRMQLKDWGKLINDIDWSNCDENGCLHEENKTSKKKSNIIRIVFPDGRIVEERNVSKTYCEFIKFVGAKEVNLLGIYHAGVNIVSTDLDSKYASYQKAIGDGWYVMTNSSTFLKYQDIKEIIDNYSLDIKVSLVSIDSIKTAPNSTSNTRSSIRKKICVHFPNGKSIQPSRVFETLIEVVKYAGAERVRDLNINCCGDNLILKNPSSIYITSCKPVGNGWLCNTYTDTNTKYEQIVTIIRELNLDIAVELLDDNNVISSYQNLHKKNSIVEYKIDSKENSYAKVIAVEENVRHTHSATPRQVVEIDDKMVITISYQGFIERTSLSKIHSMIYGGVDNKTFFTRDNDYVKYTSLATMQSTILFFTSFGFFYWLKVCDIPESNSNPNKYTVQNLLKIWDGDYIKACIIVEDYTNSAFLRSHYIVFCTKNGLVKKTCLENFFVQRNAIIRPGRNGIYAIHFMEGDSLVNVVLTNDNDELMLASSEGRAIRFNESCIRVMDRSGRGSLGLRLQYMKDEIVGIIHVNDVKTENVMFVCDNGYGIRTNLEDFRLTNRANFGVKAINATNKTGKVVAITKVTDNTDLIIFKKNGSIERIKVKDVPIKNRATSCLKLIDMSSDNDHIICVLKVDDFDKFKDDL